MERLLELARARVRAHEHRHLLERQRRSACSSPHVRDDAQRRPDHRLGAVRQRRRERLRRAAEPRHEPVRELDHLRGRAVVPLEPHDAGVREAPRQREQPLGARAREAVDRLVVVADRAEVVPVAEPEIEQRLLEEVDVLVLVDGEGAPAVVHRRAARRRRSPAGAPSARAGPRSRAAPRPPSAARTPGTRAARGRAGSAARGRRASRGTSRGVRRRFFAHSISVARSPAGRKRNAPGSELPIRRRSGAFEGQDPARIALEVAEQRERRRVEGRGAHAVGAERTQPRAELARRLVGERHRDDLLRREGAARDLPRDPARDRRRLAGPGAGEDAQRPARRLHSGALLGVQPFEDPLRVQVARG